MEAVKLDKYPNIDKFNGLQREVGTTAPDDDLTFKKILSFVDSLPSKGFKDNELYVLDLYLHRNSERSIAKNIHEPRKMVKKVLLKFEGACKEFLKDLKH